MPFFWNINCLIYFLCWFPILKTSVVLVLTQTLAIHVVLSPHWSWIWKGSPPPLPLCELTCVLSDFASKKKIIHSLYIKSSSFHKCIAWKWFCCTICGKTFNKMINIDVIQCLATNSADMLLFTLQSEGEDEYALKLFSNLDLHYYLSWKDTLFKSFLAFPEQMV